MSKSPLWKNKFFVSIVAAIIVIAGGIGGYLILSTRNSSQSQTPSVNDSIPVKTVKASDIGFSLAMEPDKQTVKMTITKVSGISTIEYDVSYNAQVTASEESGNVGGIISAGVTNSPIQVKSSDPITKEIYLGTCSRNVCKPDKVVGDVTFNLKLTYSDGSLGSLIQKITP